EPQDARTSNPRATYTTNVGVGGGAHLNAAAHCWRWSLKTASSDTTIESKPFSTASVKTRKAQNEEKESALPPKDDVGANICRVRLRAKSCPTSALPGSRTLPRTW